MSVSKMQFVVTVIVSAILTSFVVYSQNKSIKNDVLMRKSLLHHQQTWPEQKNNLNKRVLKNSKSNNSSNVIDLTELMDLPFQDPNFSTYKAALVTIFNGDIKDWKPASRNFPGKFIEEGLNEGEIKTTMNKTMLENGFLLGEDIYQNWDRSTWVNWIKVQFTYDGNNNLIETFQQGWNDSVWVNTYNQLFTNDGNNNQIERLSKYWNDSTWENSSRYSYVYDGNNNRTEFLHQNWNDSAWDNGAKFSYTFDVNNNLTDYIFQFWNGSAWENGSKNSYTYDVNNNQTEYIFQYWNGSAWDNISKDSYSYDGNNNQTESLSQTWGGSNWVNNYKSSYEYDINNNQTESLSQYWKGSAWENSYRSTTTFDGNYNEIESLSQSWSGSVWENSYKRSNTYDGNNNWTEALDQVWGGSDWVNESRFLSTYIQVTAINENFSSVNSYSLSNNYPNPFNPSTKISWQSPIRSWQTLKVYDVLGNEVTILIAEEKSAGIYELDFNGSGLASGVYFYTLSAGNFVQTKKMVLLR